MKYLMILLIVLNIQSAYTDDAVYLLKASAAPFTGYLITPDKANSIRNDSIDLSTQLHLNSNLTQENSLLTQRLTNSQEEATTLSKELVTERDTSFLGKLGMFVLGAGVTGVLAYGIYRSK